MVDDYEKEWVSERERERESSASLSDDDDERGGLTMEKMIKKEDK